MNISFKANYICSSQVKKNDKPCSLSFVQIDTKNSSDMTALRELDYMWGRKTYFSDISDNANLDHLYGLNSKFKQYYALTTQTKDFNKLDSEQILGLVQVEPDVHYNEINYLQVLPTQNYSNPEREYKNVGSSIIDTITKIYPNKKIMLYSTDAALNFYKKIGFVQDESEKRYNKMYLDKKM